MRTSKITILAICCFLCAALIYFISPSRGQSNQLKVSFINVGQGDSALLQAPDQEDILIDGGPVSAGPTVVAYLQSQHINDIDVLVASHNDADHIGGLTDVLNSSIPIKAVIFNGEPVTTTTYLDFENALKAHGLTPTPAAFGQEYTWGQISADVLNPQPIFVGTQNEDSVVLLLTYDQVHFLFTGDIGTDTEGVILGEGTPIAADVLKVAHHGSKYSSSPSFLDAVKPKYAVISVGQNSYGQPAPETLIQLALVGAEVYRTDQKGTIVFISDGQTVFTGTVELYLYLPVIHNPLPSSMPTSTPSPPTGVNVVCRDSGAAQICGWVSNGSPGQNSSETVYGRLLINNIRQTGQTMDTTWHFKSTNSSCSGTTDIYGIASCSRSIGMATIGYQVNVDVSIGGYSVTTWFTPK